MERLDALIKEFIGEKNAKTAVSFMIALDIIREVNVDSLLHKIVDILFYAIEQIKGVSVECNGMEISSVGETKSDYIDVPLVYDYKIRIYYSEDFDRDTKEIISFVQALLSYHLYNLLEIEKLKEKAMKDHLTGAYSRLAGEEILKKITKGAQRGKKISIAFVDLDGLKEVNDLYGHEAGDRYLIDFVRAFKENSREEDVIVRWGGDEFILAFPGASKKDAEQILERISKAFIGCFSYGVATLPNETLSFQEAVRLADKRMYQRKRLKWKKKNL